MVGVVPNTRTSIRISIFTMSESDSDRRRKEKDGCGRETKGGSRGMEDQSRGGDGGRAFEKERQDVWVCVCECLG